MQIEIIRKLQKDILSRHQIDLKPFKIFQGGENGYIMDENENITGISLFNFYLNKNFIKIIPFLEQLPFLNHLELYCLTINDIDLLQNLKQLTHLNLSFNNISGILPLEKLINLQFLDIRYNQIKELNGIENLINLKFLYFGNNYITQLNSIQYLNNLERINLEDNPIRDISPLQNLKNLKSLFLSNLMIENIPEELFNLPLEMNFNEDENDNFITIHPYNNSYLKHLIPSNKIQGKLEIKKYFNSI